MSITKEQIEHIAQLARLGISDEEKEKYAAELSRILDYFKKLEQVDTKDVLPIKQVVGINNVTREDESSAFENREKIVSNAPATEGKFIKVKSIL